MTNKLIVSPARMSSGHLLPGLVDADLYVHDRYVRTMNDLTMSQAKVVAGNHAAVIEANGKVVWPRA